MCDNCVLTYQSAEVNEKEIQETVSFSSTNPGEVVEAAPLDQVVTDRTIGADLKDFLSRPALIQTYTWLESGSSALPFYPWKAFFTNPQIQYKLHNYAFLRCKLKIKVMINASPFYYGALQLHYSPLEGLKGDNATSDAANGVLVPYSQRPCIYIYPQYNSGGEMELPFFYHKNWLSVNSATDMQNMGTLRFVPFTTLQSANGVTTSGVTVQVYAWAEDIELAVTTISLDSKIG